VGNRNMNFVVMPSCEDLMVGKGSTWRDIQGG